MLDYVWISFTFWCEFPHSIKNRRVINDLILILTANRDPVAKILGDGYATVEGEDNSTLRLLEQTSKDAGDSSAEESQIKLRLLLLTQQFDMELMRNSIKELSQ